jgi:hypothetical protein
LGIANFRSMAKKPSLKHKIVMQYFFIFLRIGGKDAGN